MAVKPGMFTPQANQTTFGATGLQRSYASVRGKKPGYSPLQRDPNAAGGMFEGNALRRAMQGIQPEAQGMKVGEVLPPGALPLPQATQPQVAPTTTQGPSAEPARAAGASQDISITTADGTKINLTGGGALGQALEEQKVLTKPVATLAEEPGYGVPEEFTPASLLGVGTFTRQQYIAALRARGFQLAQIQAMASQFFAGDDPNTTVTITGPTPPLVVAPGGEIVVPENTRPGLEWVPFQYRSDANALYDQWQQAGAKESYQDFVYAQNRTLFTQLGFTKPAVTADIRPGLEWVPTAQRDAANKAWDDWQQAGAPGSYQEWLWKNDPAIATALGFTQPVTPVVPGQYTIGQSAGFNTWLTNYTKTNDLALQQALQDTAKTFDANRRRTLSTGGRGFAAAYSGQLASLDRQQLSEMAGLRTTSTINFAATVANKAWEDIGITNTLNEEYVGHIFTLLDNPDTVDFGMALLGPIWEDYTVRHGYTKEQADQQKNTLLTGVLMDRATQNAVDHPDWTKEKCWDNAVSSIGPDNPLGAADWMTDETKRNKLRDQFYAGRETAPAVTGVASFVAPKRGPQTSYGTPGGGGTSWDETGFNSGFLDTDWTQQRHDSFFRWLPDAMAGFIDAGDARTKITSWLNNAGLEGVPNDLKNNFVDRIVQYVTTHNLVTWV